MPYVISSMQKNGANDISTSVYTEAKDRQIRHIIFTIYDSLVTIKELLGKIVLTYTVQNTVSSS